jgi:hypothetical protein
MSDIYKKKAKKYKYKYLKLKEEYIGEGGGLEDDIFEGGFGCVSIPPISLKGLHYKQLYPTTSKFIEDYIEEKFINKEYVGKFMSCADSVFGLEYENLKLIQTKGWDPMKYTQELCFACTIPKFNLGEHLKNHSKLSTCIDHNYNTFMMRQHIKGYAGNNNFCYLITKKAGTSFYILLKETSNIIYSNIIPILTSLKNGIYYFIINLYNNQYVLGDININNMTYDVDVNKVYFIDFGLMHQNTDIKRIDSICLNVNYSVVIKKILEYFALDDIKNKNLNAKYNKNDVINGLKINNDKFDQERIQYFKRLQYNNYENMYNNYVENILFLSWNDKFDKTAYDIYNNYIFPIVKNTDIYALSLFIYQIVPNKLLVTELLNDAIQNKINGPTDLIHKLQIIIEQLQSSSINVRAQPSTPPQPTTIIGNFVSSTIIGKTVPSTIIGKSVPPQQQQQRAPSPQQPQQQQRAQVSQKPAQQPQPQQQQRAPVSQKPVRLQPAAQKLETFCKRLEINLQEQAQNLNNNISVEQYNNYNTSFNNFSSICLDGTLEQQLQKLQQVTEAAARRSPSPPVAAQRQQQQYNLPYQQQQAPAPALAPAPVAAPAPAPAPAQYYQQHHQQQQRLYPAAPAQYYQQAARPQQQHQQQKIEKYRLHIRDLYNNRKY